MTVTTTTGKVTAIGNSSATEFSFSPVTIFDEDDLEVRLVVIATGVETILSRGTSASTYSVDILTPDSLPSTGNINYPAVGGSPIASTHKLVIFRKLDLLQEENLENQGGYFPDTQEAIADRAAMRDIQQQDEIDRSIKFPVGDDPELSSEIPGAEERASMFLAFDADGEPIAAAGTSADLTPVSAFINTLLDDADAATARATLGVAASGELPSSTVALNYIRRNSDNTEYEMRTPQEVIDHLTENPVTLGDDLTLNGWETVASVAGTTDLSGTTSNLIAISGNNAITSFGTVADGFYRKLRATGNFEVTFGATLLGPQGQTSGSFIMDTGQIAEIIGDGTNIYFYYQGLGRISSSGQEAGTSNNFAVTPGRQHRHPGHPKAWCHFNGATVGTNAPTEGYNVTSIERTNTGRWTINFTTAFSTTTYCAIINCKQNQGTLLIFIGEATDIAPTESTFSIEAVNSAGAFADVASVHCVFFGDQ